MAVTFKLGNIEFVDTEIPHREKFGPLGGIQSMAVHEFPGGQRKIQTFGALPEKMTFEGLLLGSDAMYRATQIDRLRINAKHIDLVYAQWKIRGVVYRVHFNPANQFEIPYKIEFEPEWDTLVPLTAPPIFKEVMATRFAEKAANRSNPNKTNPQQYIFPPSNQRQIDAAQQALADGLVNAKGKLSNMSIDDKTKIIKAIDTARDGLKPLINNVGSVSEQTSAARDLSYNLESIRNIVAGSPEIGFTDTFVNPNLPQLASLYLGSADKWRNIALANDLLDPNPIGIFELRIPITVAGDINDLSLFKS